MVSCRSRHMAPKARDRSQCAATGSHRIRWVTPTGSRCPQGCAADVSSVSLPTAIWASRGPTRKVQRGDRRDRPRSTSADGRVNPTLRLSLADSGSLLRTRRSPGAPSCSKPGDRLAPPATATQDLHTPVSAPLFPPQARTTARRQHTEHPGERGFPGVCVRDPWDRPV